MGNISLVNSETGSPISFDHTADFVNDYFINIGPKLAEIFNEAWSTNMMPLNTVISEIVTTEEDLSSRVIKDVFLAIPLVISKMFNLSLSTGVFPAKWKSAQVVPLFKGGEKDDVNNFVIPSKFYTE